MQQKDVQFGDRIKANVTVMLPILMTLFAAQTCYYQAQNKVEDAANEAKLRQLMFSALPTKAEVQQHWASQDEEFADLKKRIERLEESHFEPCK